MYRRDYGRNGRIGLVTPMANPTAEPEMQLLMPEGVSLLAARCASGADARQRFIDYFEQLGNTLDCFDTLRLDAAGFACTASTYLLGREYELRQSAELSRRQGYPVLTAADAIHRALQHLGAERIAMACPYPDWLYQVGVDYWRERGYQVVASVSARPMMEDTRAIYDVTARSAAEVVLDEFRDIQADALVITGTGMPALPVLGLLQDELKMPAFNSNLCLAWACLQAAGIEAGNRRPDRDFPLLSGWQNQLQEL